MRVGGGRLRREVGWWVMVEKIKKGTEEYHFPL